MKRMQLYRSSLTANPSYEAISRSDSVTISVTIYSMICMLCKVLEADSESSLSVVLARYKLASAPCMCCCYENQRRRRSQIRAATAVTAATRVRAKLQAFRLRTGCRRVTTRSIVRCRGKIMQDRLYTILRASACAGWLPEHLLCRARNEEATTNGLLRLSADCSRGKLLYRHLALSARPSGGSSEGLGMSAPLCLQQRSLGGLNLSLGFLRELW